MADEEKKEEKGADEAAEDKAEENEPEKKGSPLKIILIIGIPVLLLLGGGLAAFLLLSGRKEEDKKKADEHEKHAQPAIDPKNLVYVNMPEILVNIYNSGPRINFLKVNITLEVGSPTDESVVKALLPKILDQFLVYLRSVSIEDLRGASGFQRLREELVLRANAVTAPVKVTDVLFRNLLIQ